MQDNKEAGYNATLPGNCSFHVQKSSLNAQDRDRENVNGYQKRVFQIIEPYDISTIGTGSHQE